MQLGSSSMAGVRPRRARTEGRRRSAVALLTFLGIRKATVRDGDTRVRITMSAA